MSVRKHKAEQIVLTSPGTNGTNFGPIYQSADSPTLPRHGQQRKSLIVTAPKGGKCNEQIPRCPRLRSGQAVRDDTSQCLR